MDKFWAVVSTPPIDGEHLPYIRIDNSGKTPLWLKKIIDFYEADFISEHKHWVRFLEDSLEGNAEAKARAGRLKDMTGQLQAAVERHGYFSEISPS